MPTTHAAESRLVPASAVAGRDRIDHRTSIALCILSLTSYCIQFAVNVVLARNLAPADFDDYNVALAIVVTLSTVATLGLEKYALYQLPVFRERRNWNQTLGFLKTARRWIGWNSIIIAVVAGLGLESVLVAAGGSYHLAIPIVVAGLPVIAWGLFLTDALTAYNRQILAAMIYRVLTPSCILVIVASLSLASVSLTAIHAAFAFCCAWCVTTWTLAYFFRRARPPETFVATSETQTKVWLMNSWPLFIYSLLLTAQGQAGIIVLKLLYPSDPIVSEYAMAFSVGTFILLIATATNRYYLPLLAVHLERLDFVSFQHDVRIRRIWVGSVAFVVTLLLSFLGDHLLRAFGELFLRSYPALVVIAMGTSIAVVFSPAPYVLQFLGYNRLVVYLSIGSLILTVVGSVYLGQHYGATGVAIAYAIPIATQFFALKIVLYRIINSAVASSRH